MKDLRSQQFNFLIENLLPMESSSSSHDSSWHYFCMLEPIQQELLTLLFPIFKNEK